MLAQFKRQIWFFLFGRIPVSAEDVRLIKLNNQQIWYGVSDASVLPKGWPSNDLALVNAARSFNWKMVMRLIAQPHFANPNSWAIDSKGWNTALHWVAIGGAPATVAERLVEAGAWRTLPNRDGRRPVDIAHANGHTHLLPILEPRIYHAISAVQIAQMETSLHIKLRGPSLEDQLYEGITPEEIESLRKWHAIERSLRLPVLSVLTEQEDPKLIFEVPGAVGTFTLKKEGDAYAVFFQSRARYSSGPIPRFKITTLGVERIESIDFQ